MKGIHIYSNYSIHIVQAISVMVIMQQSGIEVADDTKLNCSVEKDNRHIFHDKATGKFSVYNPLENTPEASMRERD